MANKTVYPYGTGGSLPSSIGLVNDLTTGGVDKALTAQQGKEIGGELYGVPGGTEEPLTGTWRQGGLISNMNYKYDDGNTARIAESIPYTGPIKLYIASGYYAAVHCFSVVYDDIIEDTSGTGYLGSVTGGGWVDGNVDISPLAGCKTYVIILKTGSAGTDTIAPSEGAEAITVTHPVMEKEGLVDRVTALEQPKTIGGYVWGADLIKRPVKVSRVGSGVFPYKQAFCVYDGYIYTTDGSHIAKQDSNFDILKDVSINVGHGNSMQLVSGGKAWASGWNDQKMYLVDLSTLTVERTITLPTTGYTTAAVDERNGLMYIFQRDSYPDTIAPYNFIVYDYVNDEIVSTKVIESFSGMQSVDFYEGKILMLNGFGLSNLPSEMRIYNTSGDVVATYELDIFEDDETEGIMFERDSHRILVSGANKILYAVEDLD